MPLCINVSAQMLVISACQRVDTMSAFVMVPKLFTEMTTFVQTCAFLPGILGRTVLTSMVRELSRFSLLFLPRRGSVPYLSGGFVGVDVLSSFRATLSAASADLVAVRRKAVLHPHAAVDGSEQVLLRADLALSVLAGPFALATVPRPLLRPLSRMRRRSECL